MSTDGPFLLWLTLTHFHTSTVTSKEKIKTDIRSRSLSSDHNDNVETYLIWLCHQLDILASTCTADKDSHTDLIEPIFQQLLTTKSACLRRIMEDYHLEYHNEEKVFTPLTLVNTIYRKCKALRCINQLYNDTNPDIMALHAKIQQQAQITTQVFQAINNTLHNKHQSKMGGHEKGIGKTQYTQCQPKPEWYNNPPNNPQQVHTHDGREWRWCPKCGKDKQGKWVCTHHPKDHQDSFQKKRKHNEQDNPNRESRPKGSFKLTNTTTSTDDHQLATQGLNKQLHQPFANIAASLHIPQQQLDQDYPTDDDIIQ